MDVSPEAQVPCSFNSVNAGRTPQGAQAPSQSTFYAVLGVRPHTVCNRNLDIRTGQGDLGS